MARPPPPKATTKKPRHFEEEGAPPEPHPKPNAKGKPPPPPQPYAPPPLANRGRDPYGNVPGVGTPGMSLGRRGAMGGPSARSRCWGIGMEKVDPRIGW